MALRTPLSVTPHLYMGDSTGRPLDMGTVYFGEQDKDPEFYPIELFSDDALTKPLAQPVHTKGGYLYDKGDMVEPHAKELIYSVKVLDSYGRKVFYKGEMLRNSWNDDVIEQINTAIIESTNVASDIASKIAQDAIEGVAIDANLVTDALIKTVPMEGKIARNQQSFNEESNSILNFGRVLGSGDWHPVLQLAANFGGRLTIPKGIYNLKKVVELPKDIEILIDPEAVFSLNSIDRVFTNKGAKSVTINGGKFTATKYTSGRPHIFSTTNTPASAADLPSTLIVKNTKTLNVGLVSALVDTSANRVNVSLYRNEVTSDDNTDAYIAASGNSSATAWLYLIGWDGLSNDLPRPKKPAFRITDNIIDIWHQTESNADVIKTSGFMTKGYLEDNIVINRNINSQAEVDMFSAGERLTVTGNNFKNISTKIQGSLLPAHLVGKCRLTHNDYEFEDGITHQWAALVRGSVNVISNNTVTYKETYRDSVRGFFNAFLLSRMDSPSNGFGDSYPAANTISNNVVNLEVAGREGETSVLAIAHQSLTGCVVSGNVFSGGFDPVTSDKPEGRHYNTWTGNNIYSPHFTPEGIFRMQSAYTGAGNRISTSHGGEGDITSNTLISQTLPDFAAGDDIAFTLDNAINSASVFQGACFLLHITISGASRHNRQVFLVTNIRNTQTQEPWIIPNYSVIGLENIDERSKRHVFKLGYANGKFALKALGQAGADGHDPINVSYGIEVISSGLYYR